MNLSKSLLHTLFVIIFVGMIANMVVSPVRAQSDQPTDEAETDVQIEFFIIGFDVSESTSEQLQQVAEASGGEYIDARDGSELEAALVKGWA